MNPQGRLNALPLNVLLLLLLLLSLTVVLLPLRRCY
jgi:hypothetical protein